METLETGLRGCEFESRFRPSASLLVRSFTKDWVRSKIIFLVGPPEPLLATIKSRKPARFGYVVRHNNLSKTILQGTLEGGRHRGRRRKHWMDNIKEWTSLPMP